MAEITPRDAAPDTLDHYEVHWYYSTGSSVWFDGGGSDVTMTNSTYSMPSNATKIKVTVKPVSKTYDSNGQQTSYWIGTAASKELLVSELPPSAQEAPTVEIKKYLLTARLDNISDGKAEAIEFEVYKDYTLFSTGKTNVKLASASYSCNVTAGGKYRVRCRAINYVGGSASYGPWSPYSSDTMAEPAVPKNVRVTAESETSVKVTWDKDPTAESFRVEYTTNKLYFDSSSEVKSTNVDTNYAFITGLDSGHEWFFRVIAVNSQGESGQSEIVSKIIGTKPEPPTTWSLTTTAVIGEPVILYWVHNSEDGSKQNEAQIELTINGKANIVTIDTSKVDVPEDEIDRIYSYELDLSSYSDGAEILWRVRTRGITFEYSDWSIQRTINTYAPPVAVLHIGNDSGVMESFPFNISVNVGPDSQNAVSYHINITSEYAYKTEGPTGEEIIVNEGDSVFSRVFIQPENSLSYDMMPEDVTFKNNQSYKVTVTVAMNSGLTAVVERNFVVFWADYVYNPNASVAIDDDYLCSYITPYCLDDDSNLITDVVLSVYRREFDGTFVEIAKNIENYGSISVTDPHPSLDYARYRIVARNINTNVIGYADLPGIPIKEPAIVIQWSEQWKQFDYSEPAELEVPNWTGSMLKLMYNIDISEDTKPDSSMVKYAGRNHPVSYYGTQKGVSQSWSCEIPKDDKETIHALRRLMNYSGDVYVREPSGNGFWANIKVSMNIKHLAVVVPVTFNITRVEGGM